MKIDFFITSLGGGGAERVVCNLASYLVNEGHTVTITSIRGGTTSYRIDSRVVVRYLQKDYYESKVGVIGRLSEIWKVFRYLLNTQESHKLACFLELPVAYALIFRPIIKAKLMICERNDPEFYTSGYQKLYKKFANRADMCVCQTGVIADWYKKYISNSHKVHIIPNSINVDVLKSRKSDKSSNTIVTLARLTPQKNQKLLIEAFEVISKEFPEYRLSIYGEGPLREELQSLVREKNLADEVSFPSFTKDVIGVLSTASMFVLTSEHEGMPNALAEAMAMGVPSISTDCGGGGARELISNGKNGILIDRGDLNALISSMRKILGNPDYADKLSTEALRLRTILKPDFIHAQWKYLFEQL